MAQEQEYQFPSDEVGVKPSGTQRAAVDTDATFDPTEPPPPASSTGMDETETPGANQSGGGFMGILKRMWEKNPRAVGVVTIAIVALIIFSIVGSPSGNTSNINNANLTSQAQSTAQPPATAAPAVDNSASISTSELGGMPSMQTQNSIDSLRSADRVTEQAVQQVQSQVSAINQQLTQLRVQQDEASRALLLVINDLQQMAMKDKAKLQVAPKPLVYYIRAVVPGRAWVMGTNGQQTSVAVGDSLPGYGRVLKIDADLGQVLTQSGKVIEFSPTDS